MLKKSFKILKYIYKNPGVTKERLVQRFPEFDKYRKFISDYVIVEDKNINIESEYEEKLLLEAQKKNLNISETAEYVNNNMLDILNAIDDKQIFYSVNLNFNEFYEKKKHEACLFWFPYIITTLIALFALIAQIKG